MPSAAEASRVGTVIQSTDLVPAREMLLCITILSARSYRLTEINLRPGAQATDTTASDYRAKK